MKTAAFAFLLLASSATAATAHVVAFGSGANQFSMEFVPIGNPNNPPDAMGNPIPPHPTGSVAYVYSMGKFEVSRDMVAKATIAGGLGITLADMTEFGADANGVNRPATGVTWYEAARFVNWLNTSQGFMPAYKFGRQPGQDGYSTNEDSTAWTAGDIGFNATNPVRNRLARYFLPSVDEWYKAAYYNPASSVYFTFPTGSDTAPVPVVSGTEANTAVYESDLTHATAPADIMLSGGLSRYGTMGQV